MKKYELTSDLILNYLGVKLFRIKALISFKNVKAGELGGYIEKEENLDHHGNAWVHGNGWVYGDAMVYGDAWVYGDAMVYGNAMVYGDARVYGEAMVYGDARVHGNAEVHGNARVYGEAWVHGNAEVHQKTHILQICPIGSRDEVTTFFRSKERRILVSCGCFSGNMEEFEKAVKNNHKGTKHEVIYQLAIHLAKAQIEL